MPCKKTKDRDGECSYCSAQPLACSLTYIHTGSQASAQKLEVDHLSLKPTQTGDLGSSSLVHWRRTYESVSQVGSYRTEPGTYGITLKNDAVLEMSLVLAFLILYTSYHLVKKLKSPQFVPSRHIVGGDALVCKSPLTFESYFEVKTSAMLRLNCCVHL